MALKISRPRDAFDEANAPFRLISNVMRTSARQFSSLERKLQRERARLEKVKRDQRVLGLSESTSHHEEAFEYLMISGPEESEYSNTLSLLFGIQEILREAYNSLVGKVQVDEEEEVEHALTAVANPREIHELDLFDTFFDSEKYDEESLAEKRGNATAELEALQKVGANFRTNVEAVSALFKSADEVGDKIYKALQDQYESMAAQHQQHGQKIIGSPSLTSIAEVIYDKLPGVEDIDGHILFRNVPDHKIGNAARFLAYLTSPEIFPFVKDANRTVRYAIREIQKLHAHLNAMQPIAREYKEQHSHIMEGRPYQGSEEDKVPSITDLCEKILEIDFNGIEYQRPKKKPTQRELFEFGLRDTAYRMIIDSLEELAKIKSPVTKPSPSERKRFDEKRMKAALKVAYSILELRARQNEKEEQQKTFYRCTSQSDEESLGAIRLDPMDPPKTVSIDRIRGSGFHDVQEHLDAIVRETRKYPAIAKILRGKENERNHFMLWAPPGSGKTEVMRTIPLREGFIYLEARGADLGTAWMNETEKNPRRVFELAHDLHMKTRKTVVIGIDEGEHLLAKVYGDHGAKTHNQVIAEIKALLDGTIAYEGVVLLVALNDIKGIKEPMMRRYHVFIVGELNGQDRANLLYDFAGRGLPTDDSLTLEECYKVGNRMAGATGDLLRKPVDVIEKKFLKEMDLRHPRILAGLESYVRDENGEFDLSKVTTEERVYVKAEFEKRGYFITPKLLNLAVNKVMTDAGSRTLIRQAQDFYRDARRLKRQMPGLEALEL